MNTVTLAETLREIKSKALVRLGPDFLAATERSVRDLRQSGILERFAKVGEIAPDFAGLNVRGQTIRLTDVTAQGPVILSFYRGGW